jgi:uncharacterized membrane protein
MFDLLFGLFLYFLGIALVILGFNILRIQKEKKILEKNRDCDILKK